MNSPVRDAEPVAKATEAEQSVQLRRPGPTPGPWELVEATEHHGPYVVSVYGSDVADCYCMSNPMAASVRNGGTSYPINLCGDEAHANARLIAAAPELLDSLVKVRALIVEAAMTGFNCHDGDWAERLFASQSFTHDAVRKATGSPRPGGIPSEPDPRAKR